MDNNKAKTYDFNVLKKLLVFAKPYRGTFLLVTITSILTSVFAVARPYFVQKAVDLGIIAKNADLLIQFISLMLLVLVLEVLAQLTFIYFANWLGQHVVKDIRTTLFKRMIAFRIKYFNDSAVGRLVTSCLLYTSPSPRD